MKQTDILKQVKNCIRIVIINVVLILVLSELTGLFAVYVKYGKFFYVIEKKQLITSSSKSQLLNKKLALHPFFGYIHQPGVSVSSLITDRDRLERLYEDGFPPPWNDLQTNNYGFFSDYAYPFEPTNNTDYIVGIFGGSVAHWLAVQGADQIKQRLADLPALKQRTLVVLNFAQRGFKQPQQLHVLAYFMACGQKFDFIINLDGFNELALSTRNDSSNIDIAMPSAPHILPLLSLIEQPSLTPEFLNALLETKQTKQSIQKTDSMIRNTRSAALFVLLKAYHQKKKLAYWEAVNVFEKMTTESKKTNLVIINKARNPQPGINLFSEMTDIWMNSSLLMHSLLNGKKIPYLHVIQPNQYFSKKVLSNEEKTFAVWEKSPYKDPIENGYSFLVDRIPIMRSKGVPIISGVNLFEDISETIYSDSCCHLNQLGNEILADFIADKMIAMIKEKKGTNSREPSAH